MITRSSSRFKWKIGYDLLQSMITSEYEIMYFLTAACSHGYFTVWIELHGKKYEFRYEPLSHFHPRSRRRPRSSPRSTTWSTAAMCGTSPTAWPATWSASTSAPPTRASPSWRARRPRSSRTRRAPAPRPRSSPLPEVRLSCRSKSWSWARESSSGWQFNWHKMIKSLQKTTQNPTRKEF